MNANVDLTLIVYSGQMLLLKLLTASLHEELAWEHITVTCHLCQSSLLNKPTHYCFPNSGVYAMSTQSENFYCT